MVVPAVLCVLTNTTGEAAHWEPFRAIACSNLSVKTGDVTTSSSVVGEASIPAARRIRLCRLVVVAVKLLCYK